MIALALESPMQVGAPDSLWGVVAVVVVQLMITVGGVLHQRTTQRRDHSARTGLRDDMSAVRDNVVNGHGNLRGDIDRLLELGEENQRLGEANQTGLAELRGEVKGLTHRVDEVTRPRIAQPAPRSGW